MERDVGTASQDCALWQAHRHWDLPARMQFFCVGSWTCLLSLLLPWPGAGEWEGGRLLSFTLETCWEDILFHTTIPGLSYFLFSTTKDLRAILKFLSVILFWEVFFLFYFIFDLCSHNMQNIWLTAINFCKILDLQFPEG